MRYRKNMLAPDGKFAVILIRHQGRVFVAHDSAHVIMMFASVESALKFVSSNNDAVFTDVNWSIFSPKVAAVTHDLLRGIMLGTGRSVSSYQISNLAGVVHGFELDPAGGNTLYLKGQSAALFA